MFEIETKVKQKSRCNFCLTTFYHSSSYLVYCIIQLIVSLSLLITLIYDQFTERHLRYSVVLYIESSVLVFYLIDISLRIYLLKRDFWKKWYTIVDFMVFCCIISLYATVLINKVWVISEDIDLAILIIRFILNLVFICILIYRTGRNKKKQRESIITVDLENQNQHEFQIDNDAEDNITQGTISDNVSVVDVEQGGGIPV